MNDDAAQSQRAERWTRAELAGLALFVVIALAALPWLVHPWYEPANDASLYIVTARSLAHGEGYSYLGQPFTVRPPGFSALLAPLLAWRGTDFAALNTLVSVCGIGALACLYALLRRRLGAWLTLALVVCLWLNPTWQHWSNQVLSDVPGLLACLGCLVVERWAARSPRAWRQLALGLAIGLATQVRTVNVLLVPAIALARGRDGASSTASPRAASWKRAALMVAGVALVLLPWAVRDARSAPALPLDQNYLYSQWTNLLHVDAADPHSALRPLSEFLARLPARVNQLVSLVGSRMQERDAPALEFALGTLLLLAAGIQVARRRGALELFAVLAILPLLFFQAFLDRHVLPVYVVALALALEGLVDGLERLRVRRVIASAFAALLLAALTLADFNVHDGWDRIRQRHELLRSFADELAPRLAPGERVATYLGWHASVYLDRPVWSLMFAQQRSGAAGIDEQLAKYAIDVVALADFLPADRELQPQLEARAKSVERVPHGLLVRLK